MRTRLGAALCVLIATSAQPIPARADIVVRPGVPFTAGQLTEEITALGELNPATLRVVVSRVAPERLALVIPDGRWEIDIADATGLVAARLVALHVVELTDASPPLDAMPPRLPTPPPVPPPLLTVPPPVSGALRELAHSPIRLAPEPSRRYRVAAFGVYTQGTGGRDLPSLGGAVDITRAGRWPLGLGIAWQHALAAQAMPGTWSPQAPEPADWMRVRAIGGVSLGAFELLGIGFIEQSSLGTSMGELERWNSGVAGEARVMMRVAGAWHIALSFGTELHLDYANSTTQPWLGLTSGLGIAWTGAR